MAKTAPEIALRLSAVLVTFYAVILGLLCLPSAQREWVKYGTLMLIRRFLFLHRINVPVSRKFDNPEHYGLARRSSAHLQAEAERVAFKTRNLKLNSSDGETLGAWHIL
jgi:abhydrolase domain-containing protein 12